LIDLAMSALADLQLKRDISTPLISSEAAAGVVALELDVTVSIGIAGASVCTSAIEALMRRAGQAVYEARRLGRNCVVVSRPLPQKAWRTAE
jgi:PleD family two-component response regulator